MSYIYFMEQPQVVLDDEYISDEDKPVSDILEAAVEEPVTFSNPKLHCGVRRKK